MSTQTRRSFFVLAGASALAGARVAARPHIGVPTSYFSCGSALATPEIIRVESDIAFDQAYLDTTIPYHANALTLTEAAIDELGDDRVVTVAQEILETHPDNIEELRAFREEWYGQADPEEATHEKMLLAMGGMESCTDQSHMDFMEHDWVMDSFNTHDDPLFAYVSMMVLLMEMETHQHVVGVELAEHAELREFCERMVEEKTPQIEALKEVRGELFTRY